MATDAQLEAARRNGKRSRGPITPEGKARSSRNALKHGLYSSAVVLNSEQTPLYQTLFARHLAQYRPATPREHDLVETIVDATWRLNRLLTIETAALDHEIDKQRLTSQALDEGTRAALAYTTLAGTGNILALLGRQETRLRRAIDRAQTRLDELQKCRNEPEQNRPEPQPLNSLRDGCQTRQCRNEPDAR